MGRDSAAQESEMQLIEQARKGNRKAFGKLVEQHMQSAYYAALTFVRNHDDALELSQDAFLRAFRNMKKFRPGAKFYPWFHKILRNLCLTHLRRKTRKPDSVPITSEEGDWDFPDQAPTASERLEREELEEKVWDALEDLSPIDREILLLRDYEEKSYAEIAEALDVPLGTVMSRLFNARSRLRKKMQPYLNEE